VITVPIKHSPEWNYVCPKCGSDDNEILEQEDLVDEYSGKIIGIKRLIVCNECGHQWRKKHKYSEESEEENP